MRGGNDGRLVELVNLNPPGQRPVRVRVEQAVPFTTTGLSVAMEEGVPRERQRLLTGAPGDKWEQEVSRTTTRLSVCLVATLVLFVVAAIGIGIATYTRAEQLISTVTDAFGPSPRTTARDAVHDLLEILNHTSTVTGNLAKITEQSNDMLAESQPVVSQALNTSSSLLERLNNFAAHPSIQIGGGGIG